MGTVLLYVIGIYLIYVLGFWVGVWAATRDDLTLPWDK